MASLANLLVSMKADFGDLGRNLDDTTKKLHDTGEAADNAGEHVSNLKHHAEEGGEGFEKFREFLSEFGKELLMMGAEALEIAGVFEVLKESIQVSAEIESALVALESFTGSAEAATEVMEKMEKLAKDEALAFPEILPAAQHMMALGFSAESVEKAMTAAGNASWALGTPLESVSQRMGTMAMSGMANNRMLRTLGISTKELGEIMGVAGDDVNKAFKGMDVTDRLEVLTQALHKFGDVGAKEADTVKGRWIELKNAWHEVFTAMGEDISGLTKIIESSMTVVANMITGLSSIPKDFRNRMRDLGILSSMYEGKSDQSKLPPKSKENAIGEGSSELKTNAAEALAPLKAKEAAGAALKELSAKADSVKAANALVREQVSQEIAAKHAVAQASIDLMLDVDDRKKASDDEQIRMEREKLTRISALNLDEAGKLEAIELQKLKFKRDATYELSPTGEPDEQKRAKKIREVEIENADAIFKIRQKAYLDNLKLGDTTAKEQTKIIEKETNENLRILGQLPKEVAKDAEEAFKGALKDTEAWGREAEKEIDDLTKKIPAIQLKSGTETGKSQDDAAKQALNAAYAAQLGHTQAQEIANMRAINSLDEDKLRLDVIAAETTRKVAENQHDIVGVANAEADIKKANIALDAKRVEDETAILEKIREQTLQYKIAQGLQKVPGALGGAIAGGVVDQTGKGKSIGHDIAMNIENSLRNVGKEIFSNILTQAIHNMITELAKNTVIHMIVGRLTQQTNSALVAANVNLTAAMHALAIALGTHGAVVGTNTAATVVDAASTDLNTGATAIDAASTDINTIATTGNTLATIWNSIVQAAKAIFGFADGGSPPVGVPSMIGERGPELFVPREAGTVIPNHAISKVTAATAINASNTNSSTVFNIHGARDARETARQVASFLRNTSSSYAPASK